MTMTETGGTQKNTAYGVFVQACWAQHKRQYPDELIHKEIEEFNKQCSVWWYNLSDAERDRFQEMADRSNAQQAAINSAYTVNTQGVVQQQQQQVVLQQHNTANTGEIQGFGTSFAYTTDAYGGVQGGQVAQGQVVNAVVDGTTGQVINYSTNAAGQTLGVVRQIHGGQQQIIGGQRVVVGGVNVMGGVNRIMQKPMKDPNAPKKPLSAYFLFSQEERVKVKNENPDFSITDIAKELGKRWANLDPTLKQSYENRYQDARKAYESEMSQYKPNKKRRDPNAPKQPLSAYFIFSTEERNKVKEENPNFSICEVAKELGRRWSEMDPSLKQKYQQRAEEERQKYDQEMASYRQASLESRGNIVIPGGAHQVATAGTNVQQAGVASSTAVSTVGNNVQQQQQQAVAVANTQAVVTPGVSGSLVTTSSGAGGVGVQSPTGVQAAPHPSPSPSPNYAASAANTANTEYANILQ